MTTLRLSIILCVLFSIGYPISTQAQQEQDRPVVKVIYFYPSDRSPQANIDGKLVSQAQKAQKLFADLMEAHGFQRKTFKLEEDAKGDVIVHHREGAHTDEHYRNNVFSLWHDFREIDDLSKDYYIVFFETDTNRDDLPILCGLGFGFWGEEYKGGLLPASGECFEGVFGVNVIAHELAHSFSLAHDFRSDADAQRIYLDSIDRMVTSYCAAAWMDGHPAFNTGPTLLNQNTTVRMLEPGLASLPYKIHLSFEISDPDGIHMVKLLSPADDGFPGLRGCKVVLNGVSDTTVEFVLITNELLPNTKTISLRILDVFGNYKQQGFELSEPIPAPPPETVIISEFMFEPGGEIVGLPQWIEVYNSKTSTVNLRGWYIQWNLLHPPILGVVAIPFLEASTATFKEDFIIPPQQSRLVVTTLGRHAGGSNLSDDAVYVEGNFRINRGGFSLQLTSPDGEIIDEIGTLSGTDQTWELPKCFINGVRSSLIRRFDGYVPRSGIEKDGWIRAFDVEQLPTGIFYGNRRDFGTPGYRRGDQLPVPVELSQFSAKFVKDEVVISWTTESELDNAGFNIYRSTSRTKDFQRINVKLIRGAGTTGQRHTYQFIDKTAKPNVSYYYRIEDVDFSGKRSIRTTYRLRGVIAPTGKHITTWGTLKDDR